MKNSDIFLYSLLVESERLDKDQFESLTEESKIDTIRDIASTILKTIQEKLSNAETTLIDKSKGDIHQFREFEAINNAIQTLDSIIDRSSSAINPELVKYFRLVSKSVLYLNQYAPQFKDAYRNKKTLLILKYQSIILSIISSVSYLVSVMIDFSNDNITLNANPKYDVIAPMRSLEAFIKSVDSGEFRIILRDVQVVRESFDENKKDGEVISEGVGLQSVIAGLKNLYGTLDQGGKLTGIIYKAAGSLALIFSLREVFYSMGNMRTKMSDILDSLKSFSNLGGMTQGILGKLGKFSSQLKVDSEFASEMADREINSEDRGVATLVSPMSIPAGRSQQSNIPTPAFDPSFYF